jgi:hypothetical protein
MMRKLGKIRESRYLWVTSGEDLGLAFLAHHKQSPLESSKITSDVLSLSLKPFLIIDFFLSRTLVISYMVEQRQHWWSWWI